ncbi:prolipoprotein diacylglyceryl transferase [Candidatus Babeliales bacterium]|nr:prolipoprotein diacylglyceryl transferase [Candidatus Babeliales bacterium]
MYPKILNIYGKISINSYGVMIALGFLLFIYLAYKNPKRARIISNDTFFNAIFIGFISAVVGGRIFFVLEEWSSFEDKLEIFYPWIGGFGLLGSIIGVLITLPIYLYFKKVKILPFFDLIAIYAPLLQSISRIGCFLAGCCYGSVCSKDMLYSVVFTNPESLAPLNMPLHPAQLYSSLASFLIFILIYLRSKFRYKPGQILFLYLILESISRFSVDFWRGSRDFFKKDSFLGVFIDIFIYKSNLLSYSQLIVILILAFAFIGFLWASFFNKTEDK